MKRAVKKNSPIGKLLQLKYRMNDTAKVEGDWSNDLLDHRNYVVALINDIRKNLYAPLRKAGLMRSAMNPGQYNGPGGMPSNRFAGGGYVGNSRPRRQMAGRRPRRNFSGRNYARGGFVNNFTTRRNIRRNTSSRRRNMSRNRFNNRLY